MENTYAYVEIGDRIRLVRKELGLNQEDFGRLAGRSKQAVSFWEKGTSKPERDSLMNLQREINLNPEWVINGIGSKYLEIGASRFNPAKKRRIREAANIYGIDDSENAPGWLIKAWPKLTPDARRAICTVANAYLASQAVELTDDIEVI